MREIPFLFVHYKCKCTSHASLEDQILISVANCDLSYFHLGLQHSKLLIESKDVDGWISCPIVDVLPVKSLEELVKHYSYVLPFLDLL